MHRELSSPPVSTIPAASAPLLERLCAIGTMTVAMSRASRVEEIYDEALEAIERAAGCARAAVLLFDDDGVVRFKAWRGLSSRYRAAVEGHSPWAPGQADPVPIHIEDVTIDASLDAYQAAIRAEGIRSMSFIPLVAGGGLIGKFMTYWPDVHTSDAEELQLICNIAAHTAFAIDRHRTGVALRESQERYRSVVDGLSVVVFQVDAEGRWSFLNPAWAEVTGYPIAESLGRSVLEFVAPADQEAGRALFNNPSLERDTRHDIRCIARDGTIRWLEARVHPTVGLNGGRTGASGTLTDITEQRESAAALQMAETRLRETQRLESLGVMAGGIAHDFNNLLVGMLGNAGLAMMSLPAASPAREIVREIETAARRASDLTNQLLSYSGKGTLAVQSIDVSRLLEESARLLRAVISKKATLSFDFPAALPLVNGDPTQLRQVAMNLLTNASDALGDGPGVIAMRTGVVTLSAEMLATMVLGDGLAPGEYVALEVQDSGCGMTEETRSRMFDPFFTTKFHGRGLGMAAVLGIVRGHRGAVDAQSWPGQGTRVRVLLPASGAIAGGHSPEHEESSAAGTRAILVVDDEDIVRDFAQRVLEIGGHQVRVARHGGEALELLARHHASIALVLLDLTMPELSGEATCARIRAMWPDMPVILSSGYTAESQAVALGRSGLVEFLQKPYSPQQLLALVDSVLRHAR